MMAAVSGGAMTDGKTVVVILGDSLAAGFGVDPSEAFPALVQKRAEALGWPVTVVNAGVSGDTTAGGLRRIDWLLRRPMDILIVELGGNDGLRGMPLGGTRSNLVAMIHRAREKYPSVKVVVAGMQMAPSMGQDYVAEFRSLFPSIAQSEKASLIPFLLEGVGGVEELNQPDQIHPNPQGHRRVAENVWKVIEPLIKPTDAVHSK